MRGLVLPGRCKAVIGLGSVDRRNGQQEIEAARDLVEPSVCLQRGGEIGASPERAIMCGNLGVAIVHEGAGRAKQRVADCRGKVVPDPGIFSAVGAPVNLRDAQRQPLDPVELVEEVVEGFGKDGRERNPFDLAMSKVDFDGVERLVEDGGGTADIALVAGAKLGNEGWQGLGALVALPNLLIVESHHQQPARALDEGGGHSLQRRHRSEVVLAGPDQVGGAVDRDPAGQAGLLLVAAVEDQEGQPPIDMRAPVGSDLLAKSTRLAELGLERRRRGPKTGATAHPSRSSATVAVKATKRRMASSSAGSGSPVHSFMKNFLNSRAIAQPRPG